MVAFDYRQNTLYCEDVPLADIARRAGTPCYVYSGGYILGRLREYDEAFSGQAHRICYAVKANSNLSILKLVADAGYGFDIVSGGELFRVIRAGGDPAKVLFSGVGKTADEINYALDNRIHSFNCESEAELALIDSLACRKGVKASVAIRVNPDVDASTHPYISTGLSEHKFGINIAEAEEVYRRARSLNSLRLEGVSCHIGSQLLDTSPMMQAFEKVIALGDRLRARGIPVGTLDLGGGLGVSYKPSDRTPSVSDFVDALVSKVAGRDLSVMIEPGRSIIGEAGVLLTRVLYRKSNGHKEFVIVDAAMNDLLRPALYHSHHEIIPVRRNDTGTVIADVVGPVCESGDFLARNREVANVMPGDLLAVCTAGAYGFVLASNYNSRPRPPEVLVDGAAWSIIRARESFEDLVRGESAALA
ncbi:MAG: diaminopimelate decarboxylase [Bryobacteraceae bacterium]